ncbi:MAG: hypothetical protein CL478_12605 [Acidobacteria bacterium]|nr:hypothetical protein [Acidobacteriota bacterium]
MAEFLSYEQLVQKRKTCSLCSELVNPSQCERGHHDSNHIGPWSRWQGNLDAEIVVVGQDWGDTDYFIKNHGVDAKDNPTNNMLRELLLSIGIDIGLPHERQDSSRVFLTNAILCLKTTGGMQGNVERKWFSNCGAEFLRPLIEIVEPKVVICLGERAWRSVVTAFGQRPGRFRESVENPKGIRLMESVVAMAVYHCGARVLNMNRSRDQQLRDWQRVRNMLNSPVA